MANGTSTKIADAKPATVRKAALAVWNQRVKTANAKGKKLQYGPFQLTTEDGETVFFVRPSNSGLDIYTPAGFGVSFETVVKVKDYGPDDEKAGK